MGERSQTYVVGVRSPVVLLTSSPIVALVASLAVVDSEPVANGGVASGVRTRTTASVERGGIPLSSQPISTASAPTLTGTERLPSCGDPTATGIATHRVLLTCVAGTPGTTLSPAPPGVDAGVSAQDAVSSLPTGMGTSSPPTAVVFGLLTDSSGMETIEPDGAAVPEYVAAPTWIVEYLHVLSYAGAGALPGGTHEPLQTAVGTMFVFVNAETGGYEFALETATPTSPSNPAVRR